MGIFLERIWIEFMLNSKQYTIDGMHYHLHYVAAIETDNAIKDAEAGLSGSPAQYHGDIIKPYKKVCSALTRQVLISLS
jgi:hypothetical protein